MSAPPKVSVIMPCRNEARYIEPALASILAQQEPPGGFEVIVADGLSNDGTRDRILAVAQRDARVRLVDNPDRFTPHGLNVAIAAARGQIIVRMDAHTGYAPDYICACVHALESSKADNVGGPWVARGQGYLSRAIAAAFQSAFAVGGARGHQRDYEGPVDTVYLGCWRKSAFARFGPFDEELVRNQDDEHNLRITRGGGVVWQSTTIRSWYMPRSSLGALFRQYSQYGYWKVRVIQKHRLPASIRHMIPGAFVLALAAGGLAAPFLPLAGWLALGLAAVYLALAGLAALVTAAQSEWKLVPVLPAVFAAYHFGYGIGFVRGLLDFGVIRRGPRNSATVLTRAP
jgi:glycosyltransferase involved in cell wall biosynthesis